MPKTYNDRQIRDMLVEQAHAPPVPDEPDVTQYIRPFAPEEIAAIISRIEQRVAAGRTTQLRPDTALLAARALKQYAARPSRDSIVREICGIRGGCERQCVDCIGRANAIMGLYQGRPAR